MTFAGTDEPCALLHIGSIGKLGVEENKKISAIIFKFIKEELNIDGTRQVLCACACVTQNSLVFQTTHMKKQKTTYSRFPFDVVLDCVCMACTDNPFSYLYW